MQKDQPLGWAWYSTGWHKGSVSGVHRSENISRFSTHAGQNCGQWWPHCSRSIMSSFQLPFPRQSLFPSHTIIFCWMYMWLLYCSLEEKCLRGDESRIPKQEFHKSIAGLMKEASLGTCWPFSSAQKKLESRQEYICYQHRVREKLYKSWPTWLTLMYLDSVSSLSDTPRVMKQCSSCNLHLSGLHYAVEDTAMPPANKRGKAQTSFI